MGYNSSQNDKFIQKDWSQCDIIKTTIFTKELQIRYM